MHMSTSREALQNTVCEDVRLQKIVEKTFTHNNEISSAVGNEFLRYFEEVIPGEKFFDWSCSPGHWDADAMRFILGQGAFMNVVLPTTERNLTLYFYNAGRNIELHLKISSGGVFREGEFRLKTGGTPVRILIDSSGYAIGSDRETEATWAAINSILNG